MLKSLIILKISMSLDLVETIYIGWKYAVVFLRVYIDQQKKIKMFAFA